MVKINFFDIESILQGFFSLYQIDKKSLYKLVHKVNGTDDPILYFLKEYPIALDEVSIKDIWLHCKHITTNNDNFESFEKYGFLTLDKMLTFETPLKKFLNSKEIEFDIQNHLVKYKNKKVWIIENEEECKECFYETECQYKKSIFNDNETLCYRDFACPYRKAIKTFRSKVYHDKGEVEVHLSGTYEDVHEYSSVRFCPEILNTIERMINKIFKQKVNLEKAWTDLMGAKYFCLDFDINIRGFEYKTTLPCTDASWYMKFLDFCCDEYSSLCDVNENFYGNLFILGTGINVIANNIPTEYGQIYHHIQISMKDISITEFSLD